MGRAPTDVEEWLGIKRGGPGKGTGTLSILFAEVDDGGRIRQRVERERYYIQPSKLDGQQELQWIR